ncbi:MAG: NAD-dependent epimerase/dehydratase family protein [Candidatus Yanofskybacteria bacterium]|nr:NAD-dependent epimerase/dehydratase family protein [Candidatus Yanofskybacteria bacterium]
MKFVVTGHKGFIGTHLFKALQDQGHNVVGIDSKEGRDIRTVEPDLLEGADGVFHFAALPRVPLSIEKPAETHDTNVNGTLHMLLCARDAGVKRFVYSSSSSVYGHQDTLPLHEGMKPNPLSPYAFQKLAGEYYSKIFSSLYGLETVSLRYFNVYGEGMSTEGSYAPAVARFLKFAKAEEVLPVYGGDQTRDFTFVGDVVRANISAMTSENVGRGEIINIGGGQNYSILEIAKAISSNIKIQEARKGEPLNTRADISRAKELLDWEPQVNLLEWLEKQRGSLT